MENKIQHRYSDLTKSGVGEYSLSVLYKSGMLEEVGLYKGKPSILKPKSYMLKLDLQKIERVTVKQTKEIIYSILTDKDDSLPF
jgi:hypothetical protein